MPCKWGQCIDGRRSKGPFEVTRPVRQNSAGFPYMYLSSAPVHDIPLALVFCICLSGCAADRAYFGHESTDLGAFQRGSEPTATEEVTGTPEHIDPGEQVYPSYNIYDRDYAGKIG